MYFQSVFTEVTTRGKKAMLMTSMFLGIFCWVLWSWLSPLLPKNHRPRKDKADVDSKVRFSWSG
ncbi:hypothetical protein K450DRAFT_238824 [Umbelopsis ramanniana AG]|uniref:Uncharacterized protein n=1 Tax=Umbelopsis ramanniana AG TaxID=1314678 RepID=A0AAD5HEN3_UMBRA|nr:uncharacterized protein K450DRAFT_238824 [Umbelopsis ramanniana AG]KAI8580244.1 hypothetical protein K450DRAFT_238824 [Umbelopsis ramanniana AG]